MCCKCQYITLTPREVHSFYKYAPTLEIINFGRIGVYHAFPCMFLLPNNSCSIYPYRPISCFIYPIQLKLFDNYVAIIWMTNCQENPPLKYELGRIITAMCVGYADVQIAKLKMTKTEQKQHSEYLSSVSKNPIVQNCKTIALFLYVDFLRIIR